MIITAIGTKRAPTKLFFIVNRQYFFIQNNFNQFWVLSSLTVTDRTRLKDKSFLRYYGRGIYLLRTHDLVIHCQLSKEIFHRKSNKSFIPTHTLKCSIFIWDEHMTVKSPFTWGFEIFKVLVLEIIKKSK
jgi:hypothetical protein